MKNEPVNDCPVPRGILVAIGGHENKGEDLEKKLQREDSQPLEVLKKVASLAGKKNFHIEIITTASGSGDEVFQEYQRVFRDLGAETIGWMHHDSREQLPGEETELNERLSRADIVFFSGGDQLKLTSIYGGTSLLFNLKQRYINDGIIVAGTSAGAMALSTPMIYAGNKDVQQLTGEIKITTGLEFLKDVCIDTHFVDRSRFIRMAQVIATNPACVGIGLEEDSAIIVRNGLESEVMGSGVVMFIDGRELCRSNVVDFGNGTPISIRGLKVDLFSRTDKFLIPQTNPPHI
jgi:cyanophycinase